MLASLGSKVVKLFGEPDLGIPDKSIFEKTLKDYGDHVVISDLLLYDTYDEQHQLFINQDSMGFVLETMPLVGASEEMQKEVSALFQYILPEESSLQVLLWADPHIGPICDRWKDARLGQKPILQKLAERRAKFLEDMAFHSPHYPYTLRNFRCILSYTQKIDRNPVVLESVAQLLTQIKTALELLRMTVSVWNPEDLLGFLDGVFSLNPSETQPRKCRWNPHQSLQSQSTSAESHMMVGPGGISLNQGVIKVRTYQVKQYPHVWSLHAMGRLIGDNERDIAQIPCPFMIHYGVHVPRQEKLQKKVSRKALYVDRQAQNPISKFLPSLQSEAAELNFVREQLNKGERVVQTHFTVILFAHGDLLPKAEQVLRNLYQGQEWRLQENQFLHLPILLSTLPLSWGPSMVESLKNLNKLKTTLSTESSNLLPLQGEWCGTPSQGMLLAGRRGQLFTWSPFDSKSNFNVCVVGQPGAGKSVFMQKLVTSILGTGGRVVVLDVGRSFQKLGQILDSQSVRVTSQELISLNPFSDLELRSGDGDVDRDNRTLVKQVLASMISPSGMLSELEDSFLQMALDGVLRDTGNKTEVTDVAAWFLAHSDQRVKDMGTRLYAFTKQGTYGRLFTGASTVRFNNPLIIAEFEDIKQSKDLSAVILQILIVNTLTMMYRGDRKTRFAIIIDEAWEFLAGEGGKEFIEAAARQARKYGGLLVVGSQNAEDFHKSLAAKAAFNNSAWKCYFSQSTEAFKAFEKENLITSPSMLSLLKTIKMTPGKYGETLIVSDSGYAVGRLILDPFSQLLYSSKAEEFTAVEELVQQGVPVEEAIERLLPVKEEAA